MLSKTLLFSLATSVSAHAMTLSLAEAPRYAVAHNADLHAARLRIEEARGRLLAAGRLSNPELQLEAGHNVQMPERSLAVGWIQKFPLTARLRIERFVSQAHLAAASAEVRDAERRIATQVKTAAVKLLALGDRRGLVEQQISNSREQKDFVSKRFETGEASSADVLQLELESEQLAVEVLQLEASAASVVGELRPLLGVASHEPVTIHGTLPALGSVPARGASASERPDLEVARQNITAAKASVALESARKWEDIGVGLTTSVERTEDAPEGLSNDYFVGLKVSVPLPLWNKNEGRIQEAKAAATRAERERDALALSVRTEAEAAREEMAALAKLIAKTDATLLPKATQLEEQLRTSYGTGHTPLPEVLRARGKKLDLAQRRLDALRDYHLARVRYDAALGRNIPYSETSEE